jgi:SMC interacting uncharacterized protein involved in chromosome segregation
MEPTSRMQDNSERNGALKDHNAELAGKLKHLVEQYEKKEEHIEKILKHKDLEGQLTQAKLDKGEFHDQGDAKWIVIRRSL